MKAKSLITTLLLAGSTAFGHAATASDELAGAVIGAGAGAVIGHAIDRQDGAAVGGILGAMLGLAIANDDDERRVVHAPPRPVYGPAPVVVHEPTRVRYVRQTVYVAPPRPPYGWHQARFERWEDRREARRERREERRDERWGERHDRHGW
ncbi:MAG: YMGG-like glycine zipper-containing protein [Pseudomonadota bacterium]